MTSIPRRKLSTAPSPPGARVGWARRSINWTSSSSRWARVREGLELVDLAHALKLRRVLGGLDGRGSGVPGSLRLPFLRLRLDDHSGRASAREGDPGVLDRSLDQCVDVPVIEVRCGLE